MSLALNWRAADHIRAAMTVIGGAPVSKVATTNWAPATYLDLKPSFLAPTTVIESSAFGALKVLRGSVSFANAIPLDEQWITGSYSPDAFDINSRMISVSLAIKVVDKALYDMMSYDPADGAAWTAKVLKEADMTFTFKSASLIDASPALPYYLKIEANGDTAAQNPNVAWSVSPISLRAGRQVTMACTGTFLQSAAADGEPITISLVNKQAAQY